MRLLLLIVVLLAALVGASSSQASPPTRDLNSIRNEFDTICRTKWEDETFHRRLCQGDDVLEERMLMTVQKIETGRSHLDLSPAPRIIPGAGIMNEFLYVAIQVDSLCRGISTDDEKLKNAVCTFRERLDAVLMQRGYCYGMPGQIGADMRWHKCKPRSPPKNAADLPTEALQIAEDVAARCTRIGDADETGGRLDQSIELFQVGNGKRLVFFNPSKICSSKGNGVCSTDGCDFLAYYEQSSGVWNKVLAQSVLDLKTYGGHSDPVRAIIDLRGGNARCKLASSSFCTFELTWKGKTFDWKQLR